MLLAHLKVGGRVEAAAAMISSNREEQDYRTAVLINRNLINFASVDVAAATGQEAGKDEVRHLDNAVGLGHDRQLGVGVGKGLKGRSRRNRWLAGARVEVDVAGLDAAVEVAHVEHCALGFCLVWFALVELKLRSAVVGERGRQRGGRVSLSLR
jgi:hypothetical protein